MMLTNDALFLQRLKDDDYTALNELYLDNRNALFRAAYKLLRDKERCEDILQEVFTDLWQKRKHRDIKGPIKTYLYAMVRYQVFNEIRKGNARSEVYEQLTERLSFTVAGTNDSIHQIEYKELLEAIADVVRKLPDRCREIYQLSKEDKLSHKEIAAKLNISIKTVENQLLKASKILRIALKHFLILALIISIMIAYRAVSR